MISEAIATAEDAARAALYAHAVRRLNVRADTPAAPSASDGGAGAGPSAANAAATAASAGGADGEAVEPQAAESSPWRSPQIWFRMAQNLQLYLECATSLAAPSAGTRHHFMPRRRLRMKLHANTLLCPAWFSLSSRQVPGHDPQPAVTGAAAGGCEGVPRRHSCWGEPQVRCPHAVTKVLLSRTVCRTRGALVACARGLAPGAARVPVLRSGVVVVSLGVRFGRWEDLWVRIEPTLLPARRLTSLDKSRRRVAASLFCPRS